MKKCSKCKESKELSQFYKHKNLPGGVRPCCKNCYDVYDKKRRKTPQLKAYMQNYNLEKKYGINQSIYNEMFKSQQGCCAICEKHQSEIGKVLSVDHCHETKKVRGLLCTPCNHLLGNYEKMNKLKFKNKFDKYLNGKVSY